ncbi:glycosyl transferase family 2 [Hanstruepera neustonica]|uniref:Glycosyl transferase family 2 n=1 Tax=Hanstruepera neustonica TaxID=1445657 RepID=A0A2K1E5B9_9FLAO|nr:glycosyltransferase [Hanstruepera neustonica]PNQ75479.1 glycosyl transferase family 2 [Hanstruepera neustonica]
MLSILFYTFVLFVCFQLFYFIFVFGKIAFYKQETLSKENVKVSVILCAKNEEENLRKFLPSIINQDYPEFEIVLINDASYDDTLLVMEDFALKHNNIKIVDVKNNEAFWANKKYALTLGIKAAKHQYLLFTDADCEPKSQYWIKEMCSHFDKGKTIVLGYGAYKKIKNSFLNKLIRFETVLTAMQYISFAKMGLPYMGVGRNLAYTKETFFNANGFMTHMHIKSGDDDLFVNQVANAKNTAISLTPESFTVSVPKKTFSSWIVQKKRHITTAKYYKTTHKIVLSLYYMSQASFWLLALTLLIFLFQWKIVVALIAFRFLIQYITFFNATKKLQETDLILLIPILDFFLVAMQLTIFISNLFSKPKHWK